MQCFSTDKPRSKSGLSLFFFKGIENIHRDTENVFIIFLLYMIEVVEHFDFCGMNLSEQQQPLYVMYTFLDYLIK